MTMERVTSGFRAISLPSVSVKVRMFSLTRKLLFLTYKSYGSNLLMR